METEIKPSPLERICKFDDFFFGLFGVVYIQRKAPNLPLQVSCVKLITVGLIFVFILTVSILIRLVQLLYDSNLQLSEVSALGETVSAFVIAICRAQIVSKHKNQLNRLLHDLENIFPATRQDQLKYELHRYARSTILKNKITGILCTISVVGYMGLPLLESLFKWLVRGELFVCRYPMVGWYPFDEQQIVWYPFVYCFQTLACASAISLYFNEDLIFSTCVSQICMHYRYLCTVISKMDARSECTNFQHLKEVIRHQYKLEELQDDISELFSTSTFISFTILKLSLCMFLFSIFYGTDIINDLTLVFCVSAIVVPVYIRCSYGMDLYDESAGLLDSIYEHNWYEGTPKYRKMIITMMIRANRPLVLSAAKMKYIGMEYFKEVVVETYQIFMFLYNFSN